MGELIPFKDLARKEQTVLFEAWLDGKEIQSRTDDRRFWLSLKCPSWLGHAFYRIVPQKPSINWDHVDEKYNYLTIDKSGWVRLHTEQPITKTDRSWKATSPNSISVAGFASFNEGDVDWKDSLIGRHDD